MQNKFVPTVAAPSVRSLFIQMAFQGKVLSSGTAFVLEGKSGPLLITNRHNVTGRDQTTGKPMSPTGGIPDEIYIFHHHVSGLGTWETRSEKLHEKDRPRWYEHPKLGSTADFIALSLQNLKDVNLYPYGPVDFDQDIVVGPAEPVSVIGFPFGLSTGVRNKLGIWATGFLASEPQIDVDDLPVQLIDCRTRQGQSGSPVIAYRNGGMISRSDGSTALMAGPIWKLIGIYSGRINPESDLGTVWKASAIRELVQSI